VHAKRTIDRPGQELGLERLRAEIMSTQAKRLERDRVIDLARK
jgi:hypothetical protein